MPDMTKNSVFFVTKTKEEGDALVAALRGKDASGRETCFTFQSIISRPPEFDIRTTADDENAALFLKRFPDGRAPEGTAVPTDESLAKGRRLLENERRFGVRTGLAWAFVNWGTKWDAQSPTVVRCDDTHIRLDFSTAWNPPFGVADEMKLRFGEALVAWLYADAAERRLPEVFDEVEELAEFDAEDFQTEVWQLLPLPDAEDEEDD